MALESFYGGKPGYSPIIKGTFKSIQEMNNCFQDPTYTDVWYGELCIITPDSMYDADNGKIFRRTLKKQSSLDETYGSLYAEYLGQIVGMPGGLPKVVFNTIDKVKAIPSQEGNEDKDIWYPTGSDNGYIQTSNDKSITNFATLNGSEAEGIEFVPGMQKDNNNDIYNDNFEYTWLQMADPQSNTAESDGTRGTLHLGLKIPYIYLDTPTITSVAPSRPAEVSSSNIGSDNNPHPFYQKYNFSIPDGLRGIGIKNLRVITKQEIIQEIENNNNFKIYDPSQSNFIVYDTDGRITGINETAVYNHNQLNNDDSSIWIYDLNIPRKVNENLFYTCYAGDYKEIKQVTLNNDGTFIFTDSNGNNITTSNKAKWISSTTLGLTPTEESYGQLKINYNTGNPDTYNLPLIQKISLYKDSNDQNQKIKVELVSSNENQRTLTVKNASDEDFSFKYPTRVDIISKDDDQEFYYLQASYNNESNEILGKVGIKAGITGMASHIYIGEENEGGAVSKIETYFPDNVSANEAIVLINEDIDSFSNIPFPSFSI